MEHLDDTAFAIAVAAVAAGWVWVWVLVPGWERRREIRRTCSHTLVLDAVPPPDVMFSTLRCSKGCGHQEPALEHIRRYEVARDERCRALRIKQCPRCGSADLCR